MVFLVFGSKGFVAICFYTFSNKVTFLTTLFDPFKQILDLKNLISNLL